MTPEPRIGRLFERLAEPFTAEVLFDHLPDVVFFIKDRDGRYLSVNRTLVERCGKDGDTIGLVGVSQDLRLPNVSSDELRHLDEAIRYVEAHVSAPPSIREVARVARMSVYQLDRRMRRVFGLTTGLSPSEFRLLRRAG